MIKKEISFSGLARLNRAADSYFRGVPFDTAKQMREAMLADGDLIEVQVEGWKAVHYALGQRRRPAGRFERRARAEGMDAVGDDHDRRGRLPRTARSGQRARASQSPLWLRLRVGGLQACAPSASSATTRCRSCGATGSSRASTASSTGRPTHSSSWACGWKMRRSARMKHLRRHWLRGFARFVTFLGASKLDATAIREPLLRRCAGALQLLEKDQP